MTYQQAEKYYEFFLNSENEKMLTFLKLFAFYNVESTAVATRGTAKNMESYLRKLRERTVVEERRTDIDEQFKEVNFVE